LAIRNGGPFTVPRIPACDLPPKALKVLRRTPPPRLRRLPGGRGFPVLGRLRSAHARKFSVTARRQLLVPLIVHRARATAPRRRAARARAIVRFKRLAR